MAVRVAEAVEVGVVANEPEGFPVVDIPRVAAVGRREAVEFLVGRLVGLGCVPPEAAAELLKSVDRRERLGATAVGRGVAVPHAESPAVMDVVGIIGKSGVAVPWSGSADEQPVHQVCLLVLPAGLGAISLPALERLVRQLQPGTSGTAG